MKRVLTEKLIDAGVFLMDSILNFLDVLPDMPESVVEFLNTFIDLVFVNGWNAVCFFIPINLVKILLPLVLIVVNFEHAYQVIMWVLRKIPLVGIE